jgi:tetratricopeptide (TPR) repeat protein
MDMLRRLFSFLLVPVLAAWVGAQVDQLPPSGKGPGQNQAPPRYDTSVPGESSSRDTKIDLSPPKDDVKSHPVTPNVGSNADDEVQEMHPWNPHKALKDIEVGDFYFKRKNYRAALARYEEALLFKSGDAVANFRIGECKEKLGETDEAVERYEAYLKILPHGPLSADAEKALQRLRREPSAKAQSKP